MVKRIDMTAKETVKTADSATIETDAEEQGPFNCDKCEAVFSNAAQLMSHKVHGHPKTEAKATK